MSYLIDIPSYSESDGKLCTFESGIIPGFKINRVFYIFDVPIGKNRADHACMNASLLFVAISGSVRLSVEHDGEVAEYLLDNRSKALVVSEASWIKASDFSKDAVLMGFSDKKYEDCEYVNDYKTYKELIRTMLYEENSYSWCKWVYSQKSDFCLEKRLSGL